MSEEECKELDVLMEEENKIKNRCGMCGLEFNQVKEVNKCPRCGTVSEPSALVGMWDDCAWDI